MISDVLKIARSMKRPIIHVSHNYMLGCDEEFCTLSIIEIESDVERSFTAYVNDCLDDIKAEKFVMKSPEIFYKEYQNVQPGLYINYWNELYLLNNIFLIYNKIQKYKMCRLAYTEFGLEKNENFMNTVAKLKVKDGLTKYLLGGKYLITSFNKVHAINASDKVSVNVYDIDPISFLCEFIIDKKKYTIKEYIRYRKM